MARKRKRERNAGGPPVQVTDFASALVSLGVRDDTLDARTRSELDQLGYALLRGRVERPALEALRAALETVLAGPGNGSESGTRHAAELPLAQAVFERVYADAPALAAVHHVLQRPFRLFQCSGRDPLPGFGQQGLHTDWMPRSTGEPYAVVTVLWLLDDFTATNGATRVVPGSHVVPGPLPKALRAPAARHAEERVIAAPAGTALVFNGHLWHGGTRNDSRACRRVLQCQFVARAAIAPTHPLPAVPAHASPGAAFVLGGQG